MRHCGRSSGLLHAAERRVDVWIPCAEPVAERRSYQLARGRRRGALHHEVLAAEKVRGVLGIGSHHAEAGEGCEHRTGPLPAVTDEILDTPGARTSGMTAGGLGIPARKIEDAVRGCRLVIAPRMTPLLPTR